MPHLCSFLKLNWFQHIRLLCFSLILMVCLIFRDATLALKAEELELQKQLRRLQSQYDMLTGQASALIQGRRARVAATSILNGQQATTDDSLSARNLEVWQLNASYFILFA